MRPEDAENGWLAGPGDCPPQIPAPAHGCLTAEVDEQFRSRAYALGVDFFWHKPATEQENKMFLECIESLLGRETEGGFRGVQSKSLVDIIQLECISQSSSVLRITNGPLTGRSGFKAAIW